MGGHRAVRVLIRPHTHGRDRAGECRERSPPKVRIGASQGHSRDRKTSIPSPASNDELRRRLGDQQLLYRALRRAATSPAGSRAGDRELTPMVDPS